MNIELSSEDFVLLKDVLERYISNLRMEIAGTENFEWRKSMHLDEDRAKALLARLERPQPATPNSPPMQIVVHGFFIALD